jgi:alkylated DNA repair protein alkB family protein 8
MEQLAPQNPADEFIPAGDCDKRPTRFLYLRNIGPSVDDAEIRSLLPSSSPDPVAIFRIPERYAVVLEYSSTQDALVAKQHVKQYHLKQRVVYVRRHSDVGLTAEERLQALPAYDSHCSIDIPGLLILENCISEEEACALVTDIDARPFEQLLVRRVQHYLKVFDYSRQAASEKDALAVPPSFDCALSVIADLHRRGILPYDRPSQITVNEYQPGDGIPPHIDNADAFTDGICSLSLLSPIVMEFTRDDDDRVLAMVDLPPRSMLVITGEARYLWKHAIRERKMDKMTSTLFRPRARRLSLTFRKSKLSMMMQSS